MKITFVPSDMDAPGHYRCLWPAEQLQAHGVEVNLPKNEQIKHDDGRLQTRFKFDIDLPRYADIWVWHQWKERILAEGGINRLRSLGMATVIDVDDNYVNIPTYNPAFYGTHPYRINTGETEGRILIRNRTQRRQDKKKMNHVFGGHMPPPNRLNAQHMLNAMRCVDLVTVSTPHLAETYYPYNRNVNVLRNCVDWDIWQDIKPMYEQDPERLRIGWFGAYAYRSEDLKVIQRPLQQFLRDHPEIQFVTNDEEVHAFFGVAEDQRVTLGRYHFWDQETGEYNVGRMTAQCDIGLVPLAMNDLNQSKSHLKGMEYNAAGIPFIASPTESYQWWCDGFNGALAYSEDDWYMMMESFVQEDDGRRKMGKHGRIMARKQSYQQRWRDWFDVYTDLLGDDHTARARKSIQLGAVQKVTELDRLLRLVDEKQPRTIVEIGTARGGTLWAIAQTAPADAIVISIDIPAGSPIDVRDGKDVYTGRDRNRLKQFIRPGQTLKLIDMNSQTQAAYAALLHALEGRQIDLLFIDGDHRYEGVKHDWETYSPLVAPGGIIAFHDIVVHNDKRVGVHRLWKEIKMPKEEFIGTETWGMTPWGGIGVVYA